MDLKDVVGKIKEQADEAYNAFHAGHYENAEVRLGRVWFLIEEFGLRPDIQAGKVTESTDSEKPSEILAEQQATTSEKPAQPGAVGKVSGCQQFAEDPGAQARPAVTPGAAAAQQMAKDQTEPKPTQ